MKPFIIQKWPWRTHLCQWAWHWLFKWLSKIEQSLVQNEGYMKRQKSIRQMILANKSFLHVWLVPTDTFLTIWSVSFKREKLYLSKRIQRDNDSCIWSVQRCCCCFSLLTHWLISRKYQRRLFESSISSNLGMFLEEFVVFSVPLLQVRFHHVLLELRAQESVFAIG